MFDYDFTTTDDCKKSKIFFVAWCVSRIISALLFHSSHTALLHACTRVPDTAKMKTKMLYAATKDTFKQSLDGIQLEIQATDFSEVDESVFKEKVLR